MHINFLDNTELSKDLEQHIIVYNPLAWNVTTYINISVKYPMAHVFDDNGNAVPAQVTHSIRLLPVSYLCFFLTTVTCMVYYLFLLSFLFSVW